MLYTLFLFWVSTEADGFREESARVMINFIIFLLLISSVLTAAVWPSG